MLNAQLKNFFSILIENEIVSSARGLQKSCIYFWSQLIKLMIIIMIGLVAINYLPAWGHGLRA